MLDQKGTFALGVFIDLAKAFDTVDHEILIKKLQKYGITDTASQLIHSYLTNRKQYVKLGNTISQYLPVTCGVPQGSILGPCYLSYTLMISPMHLHTQHLLFLLMTPHS